MELLRDLYLEQQKNVEKASVCKTLGDSSTYALDQTPFSVSALEFIDANIHKPLYRVFHYRDLPYLYAGGAMELASFFKNHYSISKNPAYGSGQNSTLKTVAVQLEKISTRILPFEYKVKMGWINQLKADRIGMDYLGMMEDAVVLEHGLVKDKIAYEGLPGLSDSYGLINNPDIEVKTSATNWDSATPIDIFDDFNEAVLHAITESGLDDRYIPDRALIPTSQFLKFARPIAIAGSSNNTTTTGMSLINYLKENLAASYAGFGGVFDILPLPYLETAGANSTGRAVIYKYDSSLVRGVTGMELTRGATILDPTDASVNTFFCAFEGEVQFIYTAPIVYLDNAAAASAS